MKVSKRYTMADLQSGRASRLDVYEDYVAEYVLAFAERMAKEEHSEIAVVILVTSVFEPLGAMIAGPKKVMTVITSVPDFSLSLVPFRVLRTRRLACTDCCVTGFITKAS